MGGRLVVGERAWAMEDGCSDPYLSVFFFPYVKIRGSGGFYISGHRHAWK